MSDQLFCQFDFVDFSDDTHAGSGVIYGCVFCGYQTKVYGDSAPPTDVVCRKQDDEE